MNESNTTVKKKTYYHGFKDGKAQFSYTCAACGYHAQERDELCKGCGAAFDREQFIKKATCSK